MVKYYCDKCGKELPKEERYRTEIKISGFSCVTDRFGCEYCEDCLAEIIGKENFARLLELKAERQKRTNDAIHTEAEDENWFKPLKTVALKTVDEVKAEAIKEFAERLKTKCTKSYYYDYKKCISVHENKVDIKDIDTLVKEMVGDV